MEEIPVNLIPLEAIGLSTRAFHALRRVGITAVGDALKMIDLDARLPQFHIPNFGKKSYDELTTKIREKGFVE